MFQHLPQDELVCIRLLFYRAAICCLGSMYEKLGRMMGRSYEETVTTLVRSLKSAESQTRLEIMITLEKVNSTVISTKYLYLFLNELVEKYI